ncbi:MAG: hypothetical protein IJJ60_07265 [Clostridia bacterium]|nr:hypothetical protein [Clostridia bacterium]
MIPLILFMAVLTILKMLLDKLLFALVYRKTGNCLISCISYFVGNMLGYFLVPLIFI